MLAGRMRHGDNQGNSACCAPGSVQWMTAGRGIVHSEMPEQEDGLMWGFQLWVNLPAKDKMSAPRYQDIDPERDSRSRTARGGRVRVIAGELGDVAGPVAGVATEPAVSRHRAARGRGLRARRCRRAQRVRLRVRGRCRSARRRRAARRARRARRAERGRSALTLSADAQGARVLLVAGRPLQRAGRALRPVRDSDDEVLAAIWASHGEGAVEADALDYWLVLADQFERRGIRRQDVFERAIAIIDAGEDLSMLEELEAEPKTIAERRKETTNLAERLRDPRPAKPRRPLKKPQPLLLEPGEALTWPTDRGDSINPYVPEESLWKLGGFTQDGWGFGIVTEAGHQFHVLAYYAVQVLKWRRAERPSPELAVHCPRSAYHYGTISKLHLKRARVERLGRVPDEAIGPPPEPEVARRSARQAALEDIGLSARVRPRRLEHLGLADLKFVFPAPSGTPLDPDEPDQRPEPAKT